MLQAIKKPRTFIRRGFGLDMRPLTYPRTTLPAPASSVVFVVVFAVDIMARDHMGGRAARQRLL